MAHKIPLTIPDKSKRRRFSLPDLSGRFGFSFFLASKELFLGIMVSDVVIEKVIKRRVVKVAPSKVRTYNFDPLEENNEG
jgi:hypothetical protein